MSPQKRTLMERIDVTGVALLGLVLGCEAQGASQATSTNSVSKGAVWRDSRAAGNEASWAPGRCAHAGHGTAVCVSW